MQDEGEEKEEEEEEDEDEEGIKNKKRVRHLFTWRLKDTAGISVNSPHSLVRAGYASIAMGLYTAFRPTPLIVIELTRLRGGRRRLHQMNEFTLYAATFAWIGSLMFVLIGLGGVLAAARKVAKRWPLLLHPWGLLLLYLDVFVWTSIVASLHLDASRNDEGEEKPFDGVHHPEIYFTFMYLDCGYFWVLYYLYATYYIAGELTIIERFF